MLRHGHGGQKGWGALMKRHVLWGALLAQLVLSVGAGCSDDNNLNAAGDPQVIPENNRRLVLELEGDDPLQLLLREQGSVRVRVHHADDNTPAADKTLSFRVVEPSGGSVFLAPQVVSGVDGRVENALQAGADRASFQVVVEHPLADPLTINVVVDGVYRGALRVGYSYRGIVPLRRITTRLHPGNYACQGPDFLAAAPIQASQDATDANQTVTFNDLEDGAQFAVSVVAYGPAGNVVGGGCAVAPVIVGRNVVRLLVGIQLDPAKMIGSYDIVTDLHLSEGLPPPVDQVVAYLDGFFTHPATFIRQQIITILGSRNPLGDAFVGAMLDAAASAALSTTSADVDHNGAVSFAEAINYVFHVTPSWVGEGFTISGDLTNVLTNLTMGGVMEINYASTTLGAMGGHWTWQDFLLRWRVGLGCDENNMCCGRTRYSGRDLNLAPIGADFFGTFVAHNPSDGVLGFDVHIDEHAIALQYGNLISSILQNVVLQNLTGQATFAGAMESVFGCDGGTPARCGCDRLGAWMNTVIGSGLGGLGGTELCRLAISAMASIVEGQLNVVTLAALNEASLRTQFDALFSDTDFDLQTDAISGTTRGRMIMGNYQGPFTGTIKGSLMRTPCVADNGCGSGQACVLVTDVLNDCTGRRVCGPRVGTRVAGEGCIHHSDCATGVCLDSHLCMSTCGIDLDCPGTLNCTGHATLQLGEHTSATIPVCER